MTISPKYKMELVSKIAEVMWQRYKSYAKVGEFLLMFQQSEYDDNGNWMCYNFDIITQDPDRIDVIPTLSRMPEDVLFCVAIECGISIPMIVPAFPTFMRDLTKWEAGTNALLKNFNKAYSLVYTDPSQSIALANSTLESIIKHILESGNFPNIKYDKKDTLYKLTSKILKAFKFFPSAELQKNIRNIGSSLLTVADEIEELRSDKTFAHGKGKQDYIIDNKLYSVFVVNCVITVGMFLLSFFEEKYPTTGAGDTEVEDVPF